MPLPSLSNAFQPQSGDIEKKALYPRQIARDSISDVPKKKTIESTGGGLGLFDLLKGDGRSGGGFFGSTLSSPDKPAATQADILQYWQGLAKAATEEREQLTVRLQGVLKQVRLDGFKQASIAKTWPARIFWFFMILLIITALVYECVKCYHAYKESPVTTKFTISTPSTMEFPNVYICYGSAINRTYLLQHTDLMAVSVAYRNRDAVTKKGNQRKRRDAGYLEIDEVMETLIAQAREERSAGFDEMEEEEEEIDRYRRDTSAGMNSTGTNSTLDPETEARVNALLKSTNVSDVIYEYYQEAGFKIDDTFLECSFEGYEKQKLNCRDIVRPVVDANYFLCYVVDVPDNMNQTVPGKGLNLILNSHVNLYPKAGSEKPPVYAGIVVSIDKDYNPFNWEKTCVTAGRVTKIDLSMTRVHLEDFDSGPLIQHCYTDEQAKDVFKIFKSNYSRTTCQMDCLFQSHRNNCDCLMIVDRSILKDNVSSTGFCTPKQFTECVSSLPDNNTVQRAVNACVEHCYSPCDSYRYDMRASYAKLHEPIYSRFELGPNATTNQLIDLSVSFSRMEYAELIQQPSASFADFVANLGGQVNLWLGASLISLLQMGMMFAGFVTWTFYTKILKRKHYQENRNGAVNQSRKV